MNWIIDRRLFACLVACIVCWASPRMAFALPELIVDGGFEDPATGPWLNLFGDPPPDVSNPDATILPRTGSEHALLTANVGTGGFGVTTSQFIFASTAGLTDLRGRKLDLEVWENVVANTLQTTGAPPEDRAVTTQMYMGFYSGATFMGYHQPAGTNVNYLPGTALPTGYVEHSYQTIVPNYGLPIDGAYFILAANYSTLPNSGSTTVYFDDVSVTVVPEPGTVVLMGVGSCLAMALVRRRKLLARR